MVRLTEVTTRWKLIRDIVVEHGQPGARRALDELIGVYWLPVFSLVRGRLDEEQALEVTQDFFTDILARNDIPKFATKNDIRSKFENNELDRSSEKDQEGRPRGWFRFWLRKAARNHVIRYRKRQKAVIHGGGMTHVPVDTAEAEIERRHGQSGETVSRDEHKRIDQPLGLPPPELVLSSDDYEDPVGKGNTDPKLGTVKPADERYAGRYLAGFAPVGNTGFVVIVQTRADEAMSEVKTIAIRFTKWTGIASAPGVALALVAAGLGRRRRIRQ